MDSTLSQSEFYILLSLAVKESHGYDIMKQVERDSHGKVRMGPGTLYGSIKRMLDAALINEVPGDNPRRKYYALTTKGRSMLAAELQRYDDAVKLGRQANVLTGNILLAHYM